MAEGFVRMHPDFGQLEVLPGEMAVEGPREQFALTNILAFGGAADKGAHMPAVVGELDEVVIWESTGAADALPFWNTNYSCDVYLYLAAGEVRMEFKEPESDQHYGHYLGRTGDLMKLPRAIAHRTFSTNGKRRISMELLKRNPLWARIGEHAEVPPAEEPLLGGFRFGLEGDQVRIESPGDSVLTERGFFLRGLRVLTAYELHLEHNEFEGGFVVHDLGDQVALKTRNHDERFSHAEVVALFKGLIGRLG
jgi:hypothetical protein